MTLQITKGASPVALKCCIYGSEGVGKTTFAANFPDAVFIDIENGSSHYDVSRLPQPKTWFELLHEIDAAKTIPEIGTLIIDTADAAEALCVKHVLAEKKWKGIEDAGYGKGYTYLAEEFSKLLAALDEVIAAGKNVVVVAHAQIKKFEQPDEMGAYDRWELKLQKKCSPLIKEWSDLLLFANYKTDTMKDDNGKYHVTGGKKRVMYASHSAAYDAKNRLNLPDEMPFDYDAIADKVPTPSQTQIKEQSKVSKDTNVVTSVTFEEVTEPEILQLHQLMADYQVSDAQLRDAVGSRKNNPYTDETPISEYSLEFISNTLLKHWESIVKTIQERGNVYPNIPF